MNGYGWEVEYDFYIKKGILENSSALPLVRMVCLPSFSKEWAVSVIAGKRTGHCVVELAVADEQIWGRIQEQKINVKGEGIEAAVMKIGIIENSSIY